MFNLKRPCDNCPFRKDRGKFFGLDAEFLEDLFDKSPAFQCHKTVDYNYEPGDQRHRGKAPQQCAGLMSLLHREGKPNTIMQIAERLTGFDAGNLDHTLVYDSIADAFKAHTGKELEDVVASVEDCAVGELPADCRANGRNSAGK